MTEMEIIWVRKDALDSWVSMPAPADYENWRQVEVPEGVTPNGKYNPNIGKFEPPTPAEIAAQNQSRARRERDERLRNAAGIIAPLADAVELDLATPQETQRLREWQHYRVQLNRVDLTNAPDINWPEAPEIEWAQKPERQ